MTSTNGAPPGGGEREAGRDPEAVSRFVERFAGEMTDAGMQRMASRVFAALLASEDGSLTSTELSEQLQISPAAVSGAIRYLTHVSMVRREREPGTRRDRYLLHDQLWYEAFGRRDQIMVRWEAVLLEGAELLGPDTAAGRRVAESADFFAFVQKEIPLMMERWRAQRTATATGEQG
ncbi:MarR family transcriptional regulator [Streptomyces spiroverticillatus]|uniref:MarR family transcriptional regulator n=1 Tax=Streptomyces finlayi TaxID=67296 RepID=A0A918X4H4_9ACTN|nr:MarR family transcriptional regulator [Streptomyces finlayi]GHA33614.1 MarR family transcriptional regulator [Streptomyces spiroverticillatus]GHD11367.1 MarR family transcriptional regulator [Streptomyces finlayi]